MINKKERYMIFSDPHVPDHDIKTLKLIYKFIPFYKPDYLDIVGDLVNFTKISKYTQDPYYEETLQDEIATAREVLQEIVETSRKANPNVVITLFEGNHESTQTSHFAWLELWTTGPI